MKVSDARYQFLVHSLPMGGGLQWHHEVRDLTQPLFYLTAGATPFPSQSAPWYLGSSDTVTQLTEEAVMNYNIMELLVNKEHFVCCGLQSTDNVSTREGAAKALRVDQFEGIFNTEIRGPMEIPMTSRDV